MATLSRADAVFNQLEGKLRRLRGVTHTFIVIGDTTGRITRGQGDVTRGTIYCRLVDLKDRRYTQAEVMGDARAPLRTSTRASGQTWRCGGDGRAGHDRRHVAGRP